VRRQHHATLAWSSLLLALQEPGGLSHATADRLVGMALSHLSARDAQRVAAFAALLAATALRGLAHTRPDVDPQAVLRDLAALVDGTGQEPDRGLGRR
jgi:hypothetical protein